MIAVDTNVLVFAHLVETPFHARAREVLRSLVEGKEPWGIPWPCVSEFYGKATHRRLFAKPSTPEAVVEQLEEWMESPRFRLMSESDVTWAELRKLILESQIVGSRVHDARIAAICLSHGVNELLSADRDFSRFPRLKTRNPLIG